MEDEERFDFYIVYSNVNNSVNSIRSLKSITDPYESNLKVTMEFEFHISPNKKVAIARDHGKNYITVRPPLICHL